MATALRCISPSARACTALIAAAVVLLGGCGGGTKSQSASSSAPARTTAAAPATSTASLAKKAAQRRPQGALAGKTIVLDPGHNGGNGAAPQIINALVPAGRGAMKPCNTTGTASDSGYAEAAFNWDTALRLRRLLIADGAHVVLTRHSNTGVGPCVNERAAIGNAAHADAVLAIHADGAPASGRGFAVLYPPDSGDTVPIYTASLRLAHALHDALLASGLLPPSTYDGHDGYSVRSDLAGLNLSTRPAVFVELGNMRNGTDAAIELSASGREQLAMALERGLKAFLAA